MEPCRTFAIGGIVLLLLFGATALAFGADPLRLEEVPGGTSVSADRAGQVLDPEDAIRLPEHAIEPSADDERPRLNAFWKNGPVLESSDKVNKLVKVFSISVGDHDPLASVGAKNLTELLNQRGIKNEFHMSSGGHTWINWRQYLNQYAQVLFR